MPDPAIVAGHNDVVVIRPRNRIRETRKGDELLGTEHCRPGKFVDRIGAREVYQLGARLDPETSKQGAVWRDAHLTTLPPPECLHGAAGIENQEMTLEIAHGHAASPEFFPRS